MIFRGSGGVGDVDWASLDHAHGTAADVPRLLRAAVGRDADAAEQALGELAARITHQGTLYSATAAAVPALIRLACSRRTRRRPELLRQLALIAESEAAPRAVLDDVRSALAAGAERLMKLHFDPDVQVRRTASYVVGHLPAGSVPFARLRKLRDAEGDSEAASELLLAAGRLHPKEAAAWLEEELGAGRPVLTRAAAAWSLAVYGESFGPVAAAAVRECWARYDPLRDSVWANDSLGDIIVGAPEGDAVELVRAFLREGLRARRVVSSVRRRCYLSLSARTAFADVLAEAVAHTDTEVRATAAEILVEVRQPVPAAVGALAEYVRSPPETALGDRPHWMRGLETAEGRLLSAGLRLLVMADHPAWRPALLGAFSAGWFDGGTVDLLTERNEPYDPALLDVLRPHLASAAMETLLRHEPDVAIPPLLAVWGPPAAAATPELAGLVRRGSRAAATALAAIGPDASAAVPALRESVTGDGTWEFRTACAEALAAITGGTEDVARFVQAAVDGGEAVLAARLARTHGLPGDAFPPVLRELALTEAEDAHLERLAAAELLLDLTGDAGTALLAAERVLSDGRCPKADAARLAGRLGEPAAQLLPALRDLDSSASEQYEGALAVRRISGDPGPLLEAVARRMLQDGAGRWLIEAAGELGDALEPLIPTLRRQVASDWTIVPFAPYSSLISEDREQRAAIAEVLNARDHRDPSEPPA
ncbi:hypothetical protein ABZ806_13250 [Spirillospora sp. NPDC047418]